MDGPDRRINEEATVTYDKLAERVAKQIGCRPALVKDILFAVPDALAGLAAGEQVRTPLGTFSQTVREARQVKKPGGDGFSTVPAGRVVRLKPGVRLRSPA